MGFALLALMPKCMFCVAAYLGLGAVLGLTGREFCGSTPSALPAWIAPMIVLGLLAGPALLRSLRGVRGSVHMDRGRIRKPPAQGMTTR